MNRQHITSAIGLVLMVCPAIPAQNGGIVGYWKETEGSVIHVETCGTAVCATLAAISPSAPARVDGKNPDTALQHRPLCGLRIGEGFHQTSPTAAEGGTLYDPKSGKTYHGTMQSNGNELSLRGYIGISLFGRTEKWTRTTAPPNACGS